MIAPKPHTIATMSNATTEESPSAITRRRMLQTEFQDQIKRQNTITLPHHHDILSGRGASVNQHPGNMYYRHLIKMRKLDYIHSKANVKKNIISEIVEMVTVLQTPPGRFLKRKNNPDSDNSSEGDWECLTLEEAKKKTGQALREDAPKIRQMNVIHQYANHSKKMNLNMTMSHPRHDTNLNDMERMVDAIRSANYQSGSRPGSGHSSPYQCGPPRISSNGETDYPYPIVSPNTSQDNDFHPHVAHSKNAYPAMPPLMPTRSFEEEYDYSGPNCNLRRDYNLHQDSMQYSASYPCSKANSNYPPLDCRDLSDAELIQLAIATMPKNCSRVSSRYSHHYGNTMDGARTKKRSFSSCLTSQGVDSSKKTRINQLSR